jgi:hypothetical protein
VKYVAAFTAGLSFRFVLDEGHKLFSHMRRMLKVSQLRGTNNWFH